MHSITEVIEFLRMCGTINTANILTRLDEIESDITDIKDRLDNATVHI